MSTHPEPATRRLFDPESGARIATVNGRPLGAGGMAVRLTGGTGGRVWVTATGRVRLDDVPRPAPGRIVLAGRFDYRLRGEANDHTARIEVTGIARPPARIDPRDWLLHDTGDGGSLMVRLAALPDDGGAPLTGVEARVDRGPWIHLGNGPGDYRLPGLIRDRAAKVELRAQNSIGAGPVSDGRNATPTGEPERSLTARNPEELQAALMRAAEAPSVDWTILCEDFRSEAVIIVNDLKLAGRLVDLNQRVVDAARSEQDIYRDYDINAMPQMSGGSVTIRSRTPYRTTFLGQLRVNSSAPIKFEGISFHRTVGGVTDASGALNKTRPNVVVEHVGTAVETVVWFHDCRFGGYRVAPRRSRSWVTSMDVQNADTVVISDCEFDGVFNCGVFRHVKKVLRIRNRIGRHRINDVWSNVQSRAGSPLQNWREKALHCVAEVVLPNVILDFWGTSGHSDYHQVGARTDDRDYSYFIYANRVVNEQCVFASSTFQADKVGVGGWILGNFLVSENPHALTPGAVPKGRRLVIAHNTLVKWTFGPQHVRGYGGINQEAQVRLGWPGPTGPGEIEIRGNIIGQLVGNGKSLATQDRRIPNPPRQWANSGVLVRATNNAYVDAVNRRAPQDYAAVFAGPFGTVPDRLARRVGWRWNEDDYAAFAADVDRIFTPLQGGAGDGKGHLATGADRRAEPPEAFGPDSWSVRDVGIGGRLRIEVSALPNARRGAILGLEAQIDGGEWISLRGHEATAYELRGLADDRPAELRLRAFNSAGSGGASAPKRATPTASATPPAAFADGDWQISDPGTGGRLVLTVLRLPADGGAEIEGLEIEANSAGAWIPLGAVRSGDYALSGLSDGVPVTLRLRALNAAGRSAASQPKTATPSAPAMAVEPGLVGALSMLSKAPGSSRIRTEPLAADGSANQVLVVFVGLEDTDGVLSTVDSIRWGGASLSPVSDVYVNTYNRGAFFAAAIGAERASHALEVRLGDGAFTKGQVITAAIFRNLAQTAPQLINEDSSAEFIFPRTYTEDVPRQGLLVTGWQGSSVITYQAETGAIAAQGGSGDVSCAAALQYQTVAAPGEVRVTMGSSGKGGRDTYCAVFFPLP